MVEGKDFLFNYSSKYFECFQSGVSHSAMTEMQTIQQEGVTTTRNVSLATRNRDFFDDFEPAGFSSRSKYVFRIIDIDLYQIMII